MRNMLAQLDQRRPYQVFDRPIFILAAPRSGSSYLFELLSQCDDLWHWHAELDAIWWDHFPYQRSNTPSDYIAAEEYSPEMANRVRRDHFRYARWGREERGQRCGVRDKLGLRRVRLLDKTIANCFHLEILEQIFPDAFYLFLVRDPRATISSMMEGWRKTDAFSKPQLQPWIDVARSTVDYWSYPAPPGWQEIVGQPLEKICAWSWRQHVEAVEKHLPSVPAERQLLVRYEALIDTPQTVVEQIAARCQLTITPAVETFIASRPHSRTTVSPPERDKWTQLNREAIDRIMPQLELPMQRLGYASSPSTMMNDVESTSSGGP